MAAASLGARYMYIPLLISIVIYKLILWARVLYCREKPTLTVPGPKWAAWTRLWIVKVLASGESAEVFVDINRRYGNRPIPIILLY